MSRHRTKVTISPEVDQQIQQIRYLHKLQNGILPSYSSIVNETLVKILRVDQSDIKTGRATKNRKLKPLIDILPEKIYEHLLEGKIIHSTKTQRTVLLNFSLLPGIAYYIAQARILAVEFSLPYTITLLLSTYFDCKPPAYQRPSKPLNPRIELLVTYSRDKVTFDLNVLEKTKNVVEYVREQERKKK